MLQTVVNFVKASKPAQFIVVFLAGAVFAAVFYPTKQIKESTAKTYKQQITTLTQEYTQKLETQQNQFQQLSEQYSSYKTQADSKISDLTNQVSSFKNNTKTTTFKVVHPDGTVEEHDTTESSTDQTNQITQQVQQEWQEKTDQAVSTAVQQYQQQVSTLQTQVASLQSASQTTTSTSTSSKTETINPKNFTLDVGLMTNADYYGHVTYNLWGPFIIGAHGEFGAVTNAGGLSLGLRF